MRGLRVGGVRRPDLVGSRSCAQDGTDMPIAAYLDDLLGKVGQP